MCTYKLYACFVYYYYFERKGLDNVCATLKKCGEKNFINLNTKLDNVHLQIMRMYFFYYSYIERKWLDNFCATLKKNVVTKRSFKFNFNF